MTADPVDPTPPRDAEPVPDPAAGADVEPLEPEGPLTERRYPSTIGGAFYLLVLLAAGVGIALMVTEDWRLGVRVLAGALAAAGAARLVLPQRTRACSPYATASST